MKTTTNIAVDIGNSAIKLALKNAETLHEKSLSLIETDWQVSATRWVTSQNEEQQLAWQIASVHPQATETLVDHLRTRSSTADLNLLTWRDIPMELSVDEPDRLGIDRLISAYAATLQSAPPLIVVDAGSAITVDLVAADGRFQGGAILPGLGMQFASLAKGTANLPMLKSTIRQPQYPAKNTQDAIFSGVLTAATAAIDRLITRYCNQAGTSSEGVPIVLTGGDAPVLSPHLQHNHERMENLVCRGILGLPSSK
ncbi:MAG: type III pantothenate kinase [Rubripirellula sp.]